MNLKFTCAKNQRGKKTEERVGKERQKQEGHSKAQEGITRRVPVEGE